MLNYLWDYVGSFFIETPSKVSWNPSRDNIYLICDYLVFGERVKGIKNLQKLRGVNKHWKRIVDDYFEIWMRTLDEGRIMVRLSNFHNRQMFRDVVVEGGKLIKVLLNSVRFAGARPYLSQIYNTTYGPDPSKIKNNNIMLYTYVKATIIIDIEYCYAAFKKYKPRYDRKATIVIQLNTDMNHPLLRRQQRLESPKPLNGHKFMAQWKGNSFEHYEKIIKNIFDGLIYDLTAT